MARPVPALWHLARRLGFFLYHVHGGREFTHGIRTKGFSQVLQAFLIVRIDLGLCI